MARNMPDPTTAAANWAGRMGQSVQKMKDGINAVTVSPGQAAAAQADLWANNTQAAKAKFKANVAGVSLQAWQAAASTKGADRVAQGAQAAQPKYAAAAQKWYPIINTTRNALPPRGTVQQNIQRAGQFAQAMHDAANR
jgi:hypothetical protein